MTTRTAPIEMSAALRAEPGSVAAVREWLSSIDVDRLSNRERLDLVAELERIKHTAAATQARATHALRESRELTHPQDAVRSVGSEVALARRQSPTLGDRFVGVARALVNEMPFTMRALDSGVCSERHAEVMVRTTSILTLEHRVEVDRRVGPLLGRLGVLQAERAARRVAQELDIASVMKRMQDAVKSRRVTTRPAPDGMAYLTILGPMVEVVGAAAALRRHAQSVVSGQCPHELPEGRGTGAVQADTALQLLSGRAEGQPQPVEVHLVMTDRSLLGSGDQERSVMEPARIPGHGPLPAPVARAWVRGDAGGRGSSTGGDSMGIPSSSSAGTAGSGRTGIAGGGTTLHRAASVWLRRLYTSPDGIDLVSMDSRRRTFSGHLRRMLVLRDDVCRTPWCEAPIAHADHTVPAREGTATSFELGTGRCARCNYGKEAPGWAAVVLTGEPGHSESSGETAPAILVTTPLGRSYVSRPPPLLGWGSTPSQPSSVMGPPQPSSTSAPTQPTSTSARTQTSLRSAPPQASSASAGSLAASSILPRARPNSSAHHQAAQPTLGPTSGPVRARQGHATRPGTCEHAGAPASTTG
ncbi:MAG: DUF222 domain-containing protein [Ornithinibacter sp.]